MRKITLAIFGIFCFVMCSAQSKEVETDMIRVVVQPIAEVGKTLDFYVIFSHQAEISFAEIDIIDGLELNSLYVFQRGEDFHSIYTYAVPQRLGKIEIPSFSITIDGVEHTSKSFYINVVENITIDENSVRTVLVLDRDVYHLQDTIRMSLFQYSKFHNAEAWAIFDEEDEEYLDIEEMQNKLENMLDITAESTEEGVLSVNLPRVTFTVRELTGIANIEEFPNEVLEWYHLKFHRFPFFLGFGNNHQRMATLDGRTYIKKELARFYFVAHQRGTFRFEPSVFEFEIYKSVTEFFDSIRGIRVNHCERAPIVTSNSVEIVVR